MSTRKYNVGDRYSRLVILEIIHDRKNPKAKCLCDCGSIVTPQLGSLGNGKSKSCGCWRRQELVRSSTKHGMAGTKAYKAWIALRDRCNNTNNTEYHNYGGRGIKCKFQSFEEFISDVGIPPEGAWLDRRDNNGHYEPGNCRWVSPSINQANKRVSKVWVIDGKTYLTSTEAAAALGVDASSIVRGCNGYWRNGEFHPPRDGWYSRPKYGSPAP